MANNVDPDQMPHSVASDLGPQCLFRPAQYVGFYHKNVLYWKTNLTFCMKMPFESIYIKYWDTLTPYHTCPKIWTSLFDYLLMCLKTAG